MNVVRFLSLFVLAAALLVVQGTFGGAALTDRIELADQGDTGDEGGGGAGADDSTDLMTLPAHPVGPLAQPAPAGRSVFETHPAPATSPVAARIFRPPISVLA